jgi:hypothetical protein
MRPLTGAQVTTLTQASCAILSYLSTAAQHDADSLRRAAPKCEGSEDR